MNTTQRNARNAELQRNGWTIDFKNKTLKHSGLFYPFMLTESNLPVKEFEQLREYCEASRHIPFKQFKLNAAGDKLTLIVAEEYNNV